MQGKLLSHRELFPSRSPLPCLAMSTASALKAPAAPAQSRKPNKQEADRDRAGKGPEAQVVVVPVNWEGGAEAGV